MFISFCVFLLITNLLVLSSFSTIFGRDLTIQLDLCIVLPKTLLNTMVLDTLLLSTICYLVASLFRLLKEFMVGNPKMVITFLVLHGLRIFAMSHLSGLQKGVGQKNWRLASD